MKSFRVHQCHCLLHHASWKAAQFFKHMRIHFVLPRVCALIIHGRKMNLRTFLDVKKKVKRKFPDL